MIIQQHERISWIAEHAKRLVKGLCQLYNQPAYFNNISGEPYLETHHIIWLAKGGKDTIANTVALCPNSHRKMHIQNEKRNTNIPGEMFEYSKSIRWIVLSYRIYYN